MLNGFHDDTHRAVIDDNNGNHATGHEVKPGDCLRDHHGDPWTYVGITRVPNGASTGRVYVEGCDDRTYRAEFFPSVFDLVIIPRD